MPRIGLCPQFSRDRCAEENIERIKTCARHAHALGLDALFFGEAYLQGFNSLCFDPVKDAAVALDDSSPALRQLAKIAGQQAVCLGFGYYEQDRGQFYAAYRVLDEQGEILCHYRRRSPGWRYPDSPKCYREGEAFCGFSIKGKTLGLMVCGDFYTDSLIKELQAMEDRVDAFLWPVHCDYPLEEWEGGILEEYREHSRLLQKPVLFVNNLHPEESRARGGAYQWHKGQTLAHCPAGKAGMVVVKL